MHDFPGHFAKADKIADLEDFIKSMPSSKEKKTLLHVLNSVSPFSKHFHSNKYKVVVRASIIYYRYITQKV